MHAVHEYTTQSIMTRTINLDSYSEGDFVSRDDRKVTITMRIVYQTGRPR